MLSVMNIRPQSPHTSAAQSKQKESPLTVWEDVALCLFPCSVNGRTDRESPSIQHQHFKAGPFSLMRCRTSQVTGPAEGATHTSVYAGGPRALETLTLIHSYTVNTHTHTHKLV